MSIFIRQTASFFNALLYLLLTPFCIIFKRTCVSAFNAHLPSELTQLTHQLCQFLTLHNNRRILKIKQNQIDVLEARCNEWFELLTEMQQPFQECIDRLMSIPHLKEISARLIFAEIGPDLSSFTSCGKFCSWAGVCPGVKESAGKRLKGVRSGKGNQWLKYVLVELCSGIALTKRGFLREYFQKLKEKRGRNRAVVALVVALAHKVLRIIYSLFKNLGTYIESTQELLKQFRARRLARAALQAARENLTLASGGMVCDRTTGEVYK